MLVLRKLSQPLLYWPSQFCKAGKLLFTEFGTRKVISLNIIIDSNPDIYENITKEKLSNAEWQSIRERCLQISQITPSIVDSSIIDMCLKKSQVDNAIAYFQFLRENNYTLNPAVIGKYLRLYVLKCNSLNDKDKMEIIETYNNLREKYSILDAVTAEHCITSLCLTDQWEKAFEILEMQKITTMPGTTIYSAIAAAAFKNRKPDIAWKTLSELMLIELLPQNLVYTSYLSYCKQEGEAAFSRNVEKMFDFWAKYNIKPYHHVITAYLETIGKYGWVNNNTTISKIGTCNHCGESLSQIIISNETFKKLVESVMNDIIIGSNIYFKTNPEELINFKNFIERTKPYDVVIDGLNIFYQHWNSTNMLLEVINYFKQRNKKILVLTRLHQKKLPVFRIIQKHALIFYTNNLSADDPYLLYATMASGNNAVFVSMDLMRQHKHLLKNSNLHQEFKKWQFSHQYFFKKNKHICVQEPFAYLPTVQKNNGCWHVPYIPNDDKLIDSYEFPDKWYCLRQTK